MTTEHLTADRRSPCDDCENTTGPILRINTRRGFLQLCPECTEMLRGMLTTELDAQP